MKKIFLIALCLMFSACATLQKDMHRYKYLEEQTEEAGTAWQDYNAFTGDIADTDDWLFRDISDTPPADGTLKRLPWSTLKTQIGNDANFWVGSAQSYLSGEIVVNDESSLYNALSDVNRFLEQGDSDPEFGTNDTTQGTIKAFGNNTTSGGCVELFNAANEDHTDYEQWYLCVNGDQIEIGPTDNPDQFILNGAGVINPLAAYSSVDFIATDSTCTDDKAGRLLFTPVVGDLGNTDVVISICRGGTLTAIATLDESVNYIRWTDSFRKPIDLIDVDISSADYSIDSTEGCYGERYLVTKTSGTYDIVIPDVCDSVTAAAARHLWICQDNASETVSVALADGGDDFALHGSVLTNGNELDSPGTANRRLCIHLICDSVGHWVEYESDGTWVDGGADD